MRASHSLLLTALRRTPLLVVVGALAFLQVTLMWLERSTWRMSWSEASAAVTTPWVYLAPLTAAGAAWTQRRWTGRHGLDEASTLTALLHSRHVLGLISSSLLVLLVPLVGALTAMTGTAGHAVPGTLWPSYLLIALFTAWTSAAVGCLAGLLPGSAWFSPAMAAIVIFGRHLWLPHGPSSALTRFFLAGPPHQGLTEGGILSACLEALGVSAIALIAPMLVNCVRRGHTWTSRRQRLLLATAFCAAAVTLGTCAICGPVVRARDLPEAPVCTGQEIQVCLWPDQTAYLPEVEELTRRADALTHAYHLSTPPPLLEYGLYGQDRPGGDFTLVNGSTRFLAASIAETLAVQVVGTAEQRCTPQDEAVGRWMKAMGEVSALLELELTGTQRPEGMSDTIGTDWDEVVRVHASDDPAVRTTWVTQRQEQARDAISQWCVP